MKTSSAKWRPFCLGLNVLMHEWLEYIWQSGTKWSELRPTWGANLVVCTFSDIYIKVLHQGTQIYFNGQPIHWIHEDEFQWKPWPNCWSFVECSHWYGLVMSLYDVTMISTLRPRQNGRYFADHIFKCIFLNENAWISLQISLKFVPKVRINNIPALVKIMAWRRPGDKSLSEPMMVSLLTHICVARPQWVRNIGGHLVWASLFSIHNT